jgi:hypothetical protein
VPPACWLRAGSGTIPPHPPSVGFDFDELTAKQNIFGQKTIVLGKRFFVFAS